jgi:hypothetical protein
MHKRFVVTTVLAIALFFSQGGSFLVAAFCPHLGARRPSCDTHIAEPIMSHHNMADMPMDANENDETKPNSMRDVDAIALTQPMGLCTQRNPFADYF